MQGAAFGNPQDQTVIQATGHLEDGSTAGAASENRDVFFCAGLDVDFGCDLIRVTDHHEGLARFPKQESFGAVPCFTPIQEGFVGGEIFGGRGQEMVRNFI